MPRRIADGPLGRGGGAADYDGAGKFTSGEFLSERRW
jgi:hypothetical protein